MDLVFLFVPLMLKVKKTAFVEMEICQVEINAVLARSVRTMESAKLFVNLVRRQVPRVSVKKVKFLRNAAPVKDASMENVSLFVTPIQRSTAFASVIRTKEGLSAALEIPVIMEIVFHQVNICFLLTTTSVSRVQAL